MAIVITVLAYFCVLLLFSHLTARNMASNETFYRANRRSPWYMVAFGMVGASISGITFVSVPGMVMRTDMTYLQMCIGFILGYFLVAFLLLPIYYRYNLTTIYGYLQQRLGERSYKTGASFFLLSKMTGAAAVSLSSVSSCSVSCSMGLVFRSGSRFLSWYCLSGFIRARVASRRWCGRIPFRRSVCLRRSSSLSFR